MRSATDQVAPKSDRGVWSRAARVAAQTPESRNRVVDFLRALSIAAVIFGHWFLSAPFVGSDGLVLVNLLATQPWTQWLTWAFQVMPVFFFVGGYANGASWHAALRDKKTYSDWLAVRLQRLVLPVLPLVVVWAIVGASASQLGVSAGIIRVGSQLALVPIWFLVVYAVVVLMVPLTYAAWQKFGFLSFWALAALAVVDDVLFLAQDMPEVGWANYAFIWLAVHQLGYAWYRGTFSRRWRALVLGLTSLLLLIGLVESGTYPISMVSVPGDAFSNSFPPKLPMLLLGIAQSGMLLFFEATLGRWLARPSVWTATIVVNGMIMTIYLWHVTAAAFVVGFALLLSLVGFGTMGLGIEPGSGAWWAVRAVWMLLYCAALLALLPIVSRFEHGHAVPRSVAGWRRVTGALVVCTGLAALALGGVGGEGWFGLRIYALLLPFIGAWLAGLLRWPGNRYDETGTHES